MGDRGVYSVLVGDTRGKEPHGRPRRRWKNNINIDLQEVRGAAMASIDLAQNMVTGRAPANVVMTLWVSVK